MGRLLNIVNAKSVRHGLLLVATGLFCLSCSVLESLGGMHQSRMESSDVKPYLDAASRSTRVELGFTPLPPSGPVRVEIPRVKTHYDAMLHIEREHLSRTVAFLVRDGLPVWSGEQETHYSSREFETVDGTVREQLVISYSTVEGSGTPKGGYVGYLGPDSTLQRRANQHQLSVADARRLWDGWPSASP